MLLCVTSKLRIMKSDIKLKWFYPYPVETIWECLTNPALLKQWSLGSGDFRAEPGFKWVEVKPGRPKMNWDGKMYFEVLEVVPQEKLSYSFKGGPREGVLSLDSIVTWKLLPKEGGTELQLEHTGFEGARGFFTSFVMTFGWKKMAGKKLLKLLEGVAYAK